MRGSREEGERGRERGCGRVRERQGFKRLTKRNANQYYHSKTVPHYYIIVSQIYIFKHTY